MNDIHDWDRLCPPAFKADITIFDGGLMHLPNGMEFVGRSSLQMIWMRIPNYQRLAPIPGLCFAIPTVLSFREAWN